MPEYSRRSTDGGLETGDGGWGTGETIARQNDSLRTFRMMRGAEPMASCSMHPFRKLKVWRKAHERALRSYRVTKGMSNQDYPGLRDQICRAAQSIPNNICEGAGRDTDPQFAHYLEIALSSARELDYLMLLAHDLGAIPLVEHARLEARIDQVCAMTVNLRKRIKSAASRRPLPARQSKKGPLPSPVARPPSQIRPSPVPRLPSRLTRPPTQKPFD